MVQQTLSPQDAEEIAAQVARAVEAVPPARQVLFLVKLTLTLAGLVADRQKIAAAIRLAARDD
ncbi:hypothetical protein PY365_14830 [Roseiarcaceae bacterium H3SJ34-1]|uniref:hypothetical protein n=1 Tax=Terripilifer ovatus TaxID=3032367 RepID=UPI003AB95D9A|nr:hypothetical protein [Roseiarcaceae bacterium H3SJ34-1]